LVDNEFEFEIVAVVSHSVSSKVIGNKFKLSDVGERLRTALLEAIREAKSLEVGQRKVVDAYPYTFEVMKDDKGIRIARLEPVVAYRLVGGDVDGA